MEEKKIEKVATGTAKINESLTMEKLLRIFIKKDLKTVAREVLRDELMPRIEDALYYTVSDTVSLLFGREPERRSKDSRKPQGTRVSYTKYYDDRSERRSLKARPALELDPSDVTFETRADAMDVLGAMQTILENEDDDACVSLSEFLAMAGIQNDNYTYQKWGWQNLSDAEIKRMGDGSYYIRFPKLEPL